MNTKYIGIGLAVLAAILIAIVFAWIGYANREQSETPAGNFCTLDALVCPDGSAVGRSGPECEFEACPSQGSYVGTLQQTQDGFHLVIDASAGTTGPTYNLPLEMRVTNALQDFVGRRVRVFGSIQTANIFTVERLEEESAAVQTSNEFLEVTAPFPYQNIQNPVTVAGRSNFFEANTRIRITDANSNVLADTFATAEGWMDRLYPFEASVEYSAPATASGYVEVFEESAQDGSEIRKIVIPVLFNGF